MGERMMGMSRGEEAGNGDGNMVVRWDKFLPRMFLRVLLVEADDSTRHIIAALLRKCSYKVAAVADGLKAWETLQEKCQFIDIVLTEVELPSVSGFCLLTKIMENEACKNIPVIMMSSHDSMSMVFKCMLKGAADFLVKPIRKNELRNLWQHVWRRQSSSGTRQDEQDENMPQAKMDAIEENNAASNHSSDNVARVQKNREDSQKGSDSQSSRTKQDMEVESPYVGNTQEPSHSKHPGNSQASNDNVEKGEEDMIYELTSEMPESVNEDKWSTLSPVLTPYNQEIGLDGKRAERKVHGSDPFEDCNEKLAIPCEEAIDLIGAFDNHPQFACTNKGWGCARGSDDADNHRGEKTDFSSLSSPILELSLRRSLLNCCNDEIREKHTLNHSNASAFSRYNNTIVKPQVLISSAGTSSNYMSTSPVTLNSSGSSRGQIPVPVHMRGIGYEGLSSGYGTMMQPVFYGSPGVPLWNENSASRHESIAERSPRQPNQGTHNHEHNQNIHGQTPSKPIYRPLPRQDQNADSYKDLMHVQSVTIPSGSSSFCNGSNNHVNSNGVGSAGHGSNNYLNSNGIGSVCNGSNNHNSSNGVGSVCNGSVRNLAVTTNTADNGINDGRYANEGVGIMNFRKLSEREAALNKFRLKRKDRCFEKKVRYQSRKKLAEQRPRVKGQFVRQVQSDD